MPIFLAGLDSNQRSSASSVLFRFNTFRTQLVLLLLLSLFISVYFIHPLFYLPFRLLRRRFYWQCSPSVRPSVRLSIELNQSNRIMKWSYDDMSNAPFSPRKKTLPIPPPVLLLSYFFTCILAASGCHACTFCIVLLGSTTLHPYELSLLHCRHLRWGSVTSFVVYSFVQWCRTII